MLGSFKDYKTQIKGERGEKTPLFDITDLTIEQDITDVMDTKGETISAIATGGTISITSPDFFTFSKDGISIGSREEVDGVIVPPTTKDKTMKALIALIDDVLELGISPYDQLIVTPEEEDKLDELLEKYGNMTDALAHFYIETN